MSGRAGRPEACWSEFLSPRESGQKLAGSVLKFCPMSGWMVTGEQGGSRESCFFVVVVAGGGGFEDERYNGDNDPSTQKVMKPGTRGDSCPERG